MRLSLHHFLFISSLLSLYFPQSFVNATFSPVTKPIISFCVGIYHTCAVFDDKRMKCAGQKISWGSSLTDDDNLGDEISEIGDSLPYVDVGTNAKIDQVTCGAQHTCVKLDTGEMKCLGRSNYGKLGIGYTPSIVGAINGYIGDNLPFVNLGSGIDATSIAAGYHHSCALTTMKQVKCFGRNWNEQLGQNDEVDRGNSLYQMGDYLPFINFGTGVEVASLHSGASANSNCVILSKPIEHEQRAICWGYILTLYMPAYQSEYGVPVVVNQIRDDFPLIYFGTESRVKQLAIGGAHVCALLINDSLKCFGEGNFGKLGSGFSQSILPGGKPIRDVLVDFGKTVKHVSAGEQHTCILYDDMITMKCVGWNNYGQLGQGDTLNRGYSPQNMIPNIAAIELGSNSMNITSIYTDWSTNCVIFEDNRVKCFGWNYNGQYAIGSTKTAGNQQNSMGSYVESSEWFSQTQSPTPPTPPTLSPTHLPTSVPTNPTLPSQSPSKSPSIPSFSPSALPTRYPTPFPTFLPTKMPTTYPTGPTNSPTKPPSQSPTGPTNSPTRSPSFPTKSPTSLNTTSPGKNDNSNSGIGIGLGISIPLIVISAAAGFYFFKFQNKKTSATTVNELAPGNAVTTP